LNAKTMCAPMLI